MEKEKKKTEVKNSARIISIVFGGVIGGAAGIIIGTQMGSGIIIENSFTDFILNMVLELLLFYLAFFIQLIVHEGGHLVFGLLTGYHFVSFRILNSMIVKTKEGFRYRRMALTGTGGQCLLSPPEMNDEGHFPYILYNLGGVLMNAIVSVPFAIVMMKSEGFMYEFALGMVVCGALIFLTNGVPLKLSEITNDGYNALHMGDCKDSLSALHKLLSINALQMEGLRLKEMPEELFEIGENADLKNHMISTISVFKENRLMDEQRFDEALILIEQCLNDETNALGIYKTFLKMDRYYIQLLKDPNTADDCFLKENDVRKTLKAMKENPTVIRTKIIDAALKKNDQAQKEKMLAFFNRVTPYYPSQGDVTTEKELLNLILNRQ